MLDAAIKALSQMFTPPFRTALFKSIGLALVLLFAIGAGVRRLLGWLVGTGGDWLETTIGPRVHDPVHAFEWVLTILASLGLAAAAIFLMPVVTSLVASLFADEIAANVERVHYPADPPGTDVPLGRALIEGLKAAGLALVVYLLAVIFLLFLGFGVVIFFVANSFLLGRIYFELAAMRFHPVAEAKRLRAAHQGTLFVAGMFIAAFVSIPIVNLATPLFGTAFMMHMYKRLIGPRRESIERKGSNHPARTGGGN